jgi:autotransporter-associated beta strand protein
MNGGAVIFDSAVVASTFTVGGLAGSSDLALTKNLLVGGNNTDSTFSGALTAAGDLIKTGLGITTLSGTNTYTGKTTINSGSLIVNGSISGSVATVNNGGTIGGSGTLGKLTVLTGGNLNPGDANNPVGKLTTGDLTLNGGTLNLDITGTTPGTLHDQVEVHGGLNVANAKISLSVGTFQPNDGDLFFILTNDGTDAVAGTFNNLPEGALFSLGGQQWQITYTGDSANGTFAGTGNDVAIMAVVPEPGAAMGLIGGAMLLLGLRRRRRHLAFKI